ncbi:MAG: biotin/lipoyl-binding protein [Sulfurimonas sp.]|nr:biotin/lipoyl-binding protein [Sulfurimonas sp.]
MKNTFSKILRYLITLSVVGLALFLGLKLWNNYMNSSWTRDGRVRAEVVMIAPDVSGLVSKVAIVDNQFVKEGDLLFEIDKLRFEHALADAKAVSQTRKAQYEMRRNQHMRRAGLSDEVLSQENRNDAELEVAVAKAQYEETLVQVETAELDLERASIKAPCDGWVSNLLLRKGDYLDRGESHIAMIKKDSYWVYGYFEENKLSLLHEGDEAKMYMLGTDYIVKGHIESIASGISDRDNVTDQRLLANVNPTFTWVRLAQRIPVRIHIDSVPEGFTLVAGMTCSVSIIPKKKQKKEHPIND